MNSILKFIIYTFLLLSIFNIKENNAIIYSNYIKNYYHIPSYNNIEYSFKNDFYKNVYKQLELINTNNIPKYIYKTKLDNIILYF